MKALRLTGPTILLLAATVLVIAPTATAQQSGGAPDLHRFTPYTNETGQTAYGLTKREAQALPAGQGPGMARPAAMNGYPGPTHVLELADELALTLEQKQEAQEVQERVQIEAPALGRQIAKKELALDRLFRSESANEDTIRALTMEIARLRAELRALHLKVHLVMKRALAVEQIRSCMEAGGHTDESSDTQLRRLDHYKGGSYANVLKSLNHGGSHGTVHANAHKRSRESRKAAR